MPNPHTGRPFACEFFPGPEDAYDDKDPDFKRFKKMRAATASLEEMLFKQFSAGLTYEDMISARNVMLLDAVLPPGSKERLIFETTWQEHAAEQVRSNIAQLEKAKSDMASRAIRERLGISDDAVSQLLVPSSAAASLNREAVASVALDGETQVIGTPDTDDDKDSTDA